MELKHSFSAFEMFDQCPKKYWHLRVAKDYVDPGREASKDGERVHKYFEDRINDGIPLPPAYAKHEPKCEALLSAPGSIVAEQELALTKNFVPTGWWDNDVWLRVKADVTIVNGSKGLVLDWKTGKRRPKPFQLRLGAFALMSYNPLVTKVNAMFAWLREDTSDAETYTREADFDAIKQEVELKAARIAVAAEESVWQAKPGPLCAYCPAKQGCSYADERYKR